MKKVIHKRLFIVDENLPPDIASLLRNRGLNAIHINETRTDHKVKIPDKAIRRYTVHHPCVVLTADDDFVQSHINRMVPDKLIFVFGIEGKKMLIDSIDLALTKALSLLIAHDLIEIGPEETRAPLA